MTAETIESFYQKMVDSGVLEAGIDVSKSYTLDFANTGASLELQKSLTGK